MQPPIQVHAGETLRRHQRTALYAIFFLSGFCGLIYESIWSHYLKLLLGHAAYAQAVVLVVFVGGLALGAWLAGRFAHRIREPIVWYAAMEAAVALMAFLFQGVFETTSAWATSVFLPAACSEAGACAATWVLAAALILPASILLGTTFPLMTTGVIRLGALPGRGLSLLYFLNSAGAALGVVASGFVLIPALGLPGTMMLVGACNAFVAIAAYTAARVGRPAAAPAPAASAAEGGGGTRELRLLLLVAALTGLSSFIYEVVWIRLLTLVLGAATHAFELMLAPFILGLALGAWWIRNRIDGARDAVLLLARIQLLMGLLAVATLPLYAGSYDAMAWVLSALQRSPQGYELYNVVSGLTAAAVMLPATVCAGMTLPLITALLLRRGYGERQVGQVYGINTFGAIAGVLLAVHLLIPGLGLKWALAAGALIDIALGVALWLWVRERHPPQAAGKRRWAGIGGPVLAGTLGVALVAAITTAAPLGPERVASGVFRHGKARIPDQRAVLFHRDGKTASVTVVERPDGVRSLLTNGKSDGSSHPQRRVRTQDDHTMILTGALGPAHHPAAKTAAVVGIGTGTTSAVLLDIASIERVDTIEIEPMMVEAANLFRPRVDRVFTDPRSRIVIDDARAHFSKTRSRYDLIVSEPSNPWVSGVASLFTVEFYAHVANHLAEGGHFVQWLQLYEAGPEMAASILRAFTLVFPEFSAYATNTGDMVLIARRDGRLPVLSGAALDGMPGLQKNLLELGIDSTAMLAAHETGRGSAIKLLADSFAVPPNSDYQPYVDNHAASDRFQGKIASLLFDLRNAPVPLLEVGRPPLAHVGEVRSATQWMPPHVVSLASGWHGHRYLRGERLEAGEMAYLSHRAVDYALVRQWLSQCKLPEGTGDAWAAMVRVAADVNRALPAEAATAYWREAEQRCGAGLAPAQRAWLQLFAATGSRKAVDMYRKGEQVLALDHALVPETRAYAALAAAAGGLFSNQRPRADVLLQEQLALLPPHHVAAPWFRYLHFATLAKGPAKPNP